MVAKLEVREVVRPEYNSHEISFEFQQNETIND